jgi:hypothetical protein
VSFNVVHDAEREGRVEAYHLRVYLDKSASFSITEIETLMYSRALDSDEDGSDIAIDAETMNWLRVELTAGRAKVPS